MSSSFPLDKIDLFDAVKPQTLKAVEALINDRWLAPREIIFFPDENRHQLYLIGGGTVRLYKLSPEGKELTLSVLGTGECFGEVALLDGIPDDCYAIAREKVWLGMVSKKELQPLMNVDASLLWALTKLIASRRREVEMQLGDFAFKDVKSRLATLLLRLADKHGNKYPRGIFNAIKLTHQDMATLIGAARATTTKSLNQFKGSGALDFNRERLYIRDRASLERIAMGETEHAVWEALGI